MGTELLIPFLASLFVILLFRKLDRSNYRLNQIRRYTSKINEEINHIAMYGIQSVKDSTIDLEIMNKQAKKLISDFQDKITEAKMLMDSLKGNKENLDALSNDLTGVVNLTNEIRHESEYIQEGLKVIQNQREEIKKVSKDIDAVKDEVDGLIFLFNERLNNRTQDVLESLAAKIVELDSALDTKTEKIDHELNSFLTSSKDIIQNQTNDIIQNTIGKVELLEQKMHDSFLILKETEKSIDNKTIRLKETAEIVTDKMERIETRVEDKIERSNAFLDGKLDEFEEKVDDKLGNILDQVSQTKEGFLTGIKNEVESIRQEIESLSLETLTRRDEIINDTRRQAETMNKSITIFQEKYLEADNKLFKEAQKQKSELLSDINKFENDYRFLKESFQAEAKIMQNSILDSLKNFEAEMDRASTSIENATRDKFINLKEELENSLLIVHEQKKEELVEDLRHIESKIKDLGHDTLAKIKSVDQYFEDLKNALMETSKDIVTQVEKDIALVGQGFDREKIKLDQKLEQLAENWAIELEKVKGRTAKDIDSLVERLRDIHVEGREMTEMIKNEYNQQKIQLDGNVKKAIETLNVQSEGISQALHEKMKRSQYEAEQTVGRIQKAAINLYEKQESLLSDYGDQIYRDVQAKLEKAREDAADVLEDVQKAGNSLLEKQEEKIGQFNTTLDEKISRQLTILMDKGQFQLDQLEFRIGKYVNDVKQNLEHSLKNAKVDSDRQLENFNMQVQKSFKEIERANAKFLEKTKSSFDNTREDFVKMKNSVDDDLEKLERAKLSLFDDLDREGERIKATINLISDRIIELELQSRLFSDTETVISKSETILKSLVETLQDIKNEKATLSEYLKNGEVIDTARRELRYDLELLDSQKSRIMELMEEMENVNHTFDLINQRTDELDKKFSVINVLENKLTGLQRIQTDIEKRLVEIHSVNEKVFELGEVITSQNRSSLEISDRLNHVSKEIELVEVRENDILETISIVEEKTNVLNNRILDIRSIESKFAKVENLMMDLSTRHKQIATLQNRIEALKSETDEMKLNMEKLLENAEEKFHKLSTFLEVVNTVTSVSKQNKGRTSSSLNNSEIMKRKKATVINLYENFNWSPEIISEKLNMEQSMVDTIIHNNNTSTKTHQTTYA
ncbi:MAG: hypothetical protein H7A23_25135 [Leptospiraceae bacterium]|nr:hypothetical protein [Leptospiraceae bacterium]MCP5497852.1 hypothetical protein [Leptospiraceae bacterium]